MNCSVAGALFDQEQVVPGGAARLPERLGRDDEEDDGHDHENCPFCKAKREGGKVPNPTAIVQIVDEEQKVLPIDARELFEVEEGDMVVVTGSAQVDAIGSLTLSAKGVYVRR